MGAEDKGVIRLAGREGGRRDALLATPLSRVSGGWDPGKVLGTQRHLAEWKKFTF